MSTQQPFMGPVYNAEETHLLFAEDTPEIIGPVSTAINYLIRIPEPNMHLFMEIDEADRYYKDEHDKTKPTVVILDNNTPNSLLTGYHFAMQLLEEAKTHKNLFIVTISSSDMGLVYEDAGAHIANLQSKGGEFWTKHTERHQMTLWLGECLRTGIMTPRNAWLERLGFETRYQATREDKIAEEKELFFLFHALHDAENDPIKVNAILERKNLTIFKSSTEAGHIYSAHLSKFDLEVDQAGQAFPIQKVQIQNNLLFLIPLIILEKYLLIRYLYCYKYDTISSKIQTASILSMLLLLFLIVSAQ